MRKREGRNLNKKIKRRKRKEKERKERKKIKLRMEKIRCLKLIKVGS